jgi:hypothetical protein
MEVGAQRDKFRVLREHALALVRDYNKVRRPGLPRAAPRFGAHARRERLLTAVS